MTRNCHSVMIAFRSLHRLRHRMVNYTVEQQVFGQGIAIFGRDLAVDVRLVLPPFDVLRIAYAKGPFHFLPGRGFRRGDRGAQLRFGLVARDVHDPAISLATISCTATWRASSTKSMMSSTV